jgi:hypothetical protein
MQLANAAFVGALMDIGRKRKRADGVAGDSKGGYVE